MQIESDNTYPDCKQCGTCCAINVLCMTADDYLKMKHFVEERGIAPIDYDRRRCCFQNPNGTCLIWEARPQVCRLYNCHVPRWRILETHPSIEIDDDLWMIDLHAMFVERADAEPQQ